MKDDNLSQCKKIVRYLSRGYGLTQAKAYRAISSECTRLAARIYDLKRLGYDIGTTGGKSKTGHYYAIYFLRSFKR